MDGLTNGHAVPRGTCIGPPTGAPGAGEKTERRRVSSSRGTSRWRRARSPRGVGSSARARHREHRSEPCAGRPAASGCWDGRHSRQPLLRRRSLAVCGRSGCTCTCLSVRLAAGTATSTPTRRRSWPVRARRPAGIGRAARRAGTGRQRRRPGPAETVFVGGGTPSLLGGAGLRRVLDAVRATVGHRGRGRGDHRGEPGVHLAGVLRRDRRGRIHPGVARHAVRRARTCSPCWTAGTRRAGGRGGRRGARRRGGPGQSRPDLRDAGGERGRPARDRWTRCWRPGWTTCRPTP